MYKSFIKIMMALSVAMAIGACKPSQEQIMASAKTVMQVNKDIDSIYLQLSNSFDTYDAQTMDNALEALKTGLCEAESKLNGMKAMDECAELKSVISNKVAVMKELSLKECSEQLRIYKIDDDQFNDSLRREWDGYAASAEKKLKEANKLVNEAYSKLTQNPNK